MGRSSAKCIKKECHNQTMKNNSNLKYDRDRSLVFIRDFMSVKKGGNLETT